MKEFVQKFNYKNNNNLNGLDAMITFKNYDAATKSIDWSKLPDVLKKTHDQLMPDAKKGAYKNDEDVKRVVDKYIDKLNSEIAKQKTYAKPGKTEQKDKVFDDIKDAVKKSFPGAKVVDLSKQKFVDFENKVTAAVEKLLDVSRSDAQGVIEANAELVRDSFVKKLTPGQTAKLIENKSEKSSSGVEKLSDEVAIIKRYVGFHGKTKTKDQVMNLLKALQKAALEKRISKTSIYATEIMQIQDSLISIVNDGGNTFKIQIAPKSIERYQEIINSYHPLLSIALLKRYVGLQEKTGVGTYEKLQRLKNDISKAINSGKVSKDDKYYSQLNHALRNIDRTPRKLQIRTAELTGLQGIKELWNTTKSIATKTGKVAHKAYNVAKAGASAAYKSGKQEYRRNNLGGKSVDDKFENKKEILTWLNTLSDEDFANEYAYAFSSVYDKVLYRIEDPKTRKEYTKELVERVVERGGLGFIPTVIASAIAAGAAQAITSKALAGTEEVMSVDNAKKQVFNEIGLTGDHKKLIGEACYPITIFLYGNGGSGKSGLALKLADDIASKGKKVLYVAGEQYGTPTFVRLIQNVNVKGGENFKIVKDLSTLPINDFDLIVIDSKEASKLYSSDDFVELRQMYPGKSWILTSQGTKSGSFRGGYQWENEVDTMIYCSNGTASTMEEKNRWGGRAEIKLF